MVELQENPFYLLDVSMYDTREEIIDVADDKSFDDPDNEDSYEKAKNVLLNPKLRIDAEMRWFPCLDREIEEKIKNSLKRKTVCSFNLPNPLAQLNLNCYQLSYQNKKNLPQAVYKLDELYSQLNSGNVLEWLDKMRSAIKYPLINSEGIIKSELTVLQEEIQTTIHNVIKNIPFFDYVAFANELVLYVNKKHGAILENFFTSYELDTNAYLEEHGEKIIDLSNKINNGDFDKFNELKKEVIPWAKICKALVLSKKSMGLSFPLAENMFWHLRSLSVDLYNKKNNAELALEVINLLPEQFSYLLDQGGETEEKINKDISFLEESVNQNKLSPEFQEADNAFNDMIATMNKNLFFEDGHSNEIMKFYKTVFQRNYVPSIQGFLRHDNIGEKERELLYYYAAIIYHKMGSSLTWADEDQLANQVGKAGLEYAKKSRDTKAVESLEELVTSTAFSDAESTFVEMLKNMNNNIFFEDGHKFQIMQFYKKHFQYEYTSKIKNLLCYPDLNEEQKKILYYYAAILYSRMSNSLTWADEIQLANQVAKDGLRYALKSEDEKTIQRLQETINETNAYKNIVLNTTNEVSTSSNNASVTRQDSNSSGGCLWYLVLGGIGLAIGGPIGAFIGCWLASKINGD